MTGVFYKGDTTDSFSWPRVLFTTLILIGLLVAAIYTAGDDDLESLNTVLVHGFELTLGAALGLLTGETINKT
jgi:hypothetical protein